MGIPCWILLPYEVNWRWHDNLNKCDWYDSLKLFRQRTSGNWDSVFGQVENILRKGLSVKNKPSETLKV